MDSEIPEIYKNRVRVRVCGLCWNDDRLLMVNHRGLTAGNFWAPPGGGVELGEPLADALQRELYEETGVRIGAQKFRFVCEYLQPPLHAIEIFFDVEYRSGEVIRGTDPESPAEGQLITEVKYLRMEEILALPAGERHGIFNRVKSAGELKSLTGLFRI